MRQTFDVRGGPQDGRKHLPLLRAEMAKQNLDVFYIPHEDEYQNEYLPDANERLAWATGFTGSAGSALIMADRAVLFVDGRYTLQGVDQTDPDLFEQGVQPDPGPFNWLSDQALSGKKVGYDPRLMSPNALKSLADAVTRAGAELVAVETNPIDAAWLDRPAQPSAVVVPHELTFSGQSSSEKRAEIAAGLKESGADAAIITAPASIAWLFNIRGGDVQCTPLPLGRAIVRSDGSAELFLDEVKVSDGLREHLGNEVSLRPLAELDEGLASLQEQTISLDPAAASAWFFNTLETAGANILKAMDPCALPKARKNAAEIAGTTRAHQRDAEAVIKFLHWLDTEAQSGEVTEIQSVEVLENFREATGGLADLSFETISGSGPNGALPHYRVSSASDRKLQHGELYLVDSGGQYLDGTTDVTRTVAIGTPTEEMRERFTLVLKGHIALSTVRFPPGTTGTHLDTLARHALWQAGLDYEHGTGHGVGVYLGVHEGPQRIAKPWNATALQPGMIVSNEPGYYKTGGYGIRIENLQYVTEPEAIPGGEIDMLGFHPITLAPIAANLIQLDKLTKDERDWLNAYHARVWAEIGPRLEGEVRDWLEKACAAL